MEDFYTLTKEEKDLISKTMPKGYIPSLVLRSNRRESRYPSLLKGVLATLKYDFEKYGNIKTAIVNLEEEYGRKIFPKYVSVIYLTPEANDLFLSNRWHIFKFKRMQKWDDERMLNLFRNKDGKYFDAMSLPLVLVNMDKSKIICNFVENEFPMVETDCVYKNGKALITFALKDTIADRHKGKKGLQERINKKIEEKLKAIDIQFLDCNANEIDKVVIPVKPSRRPKKDRIDSMDK